MKDLISLYRFNLKRMMGNWMTKLMFGIVVIGLLAGAFLYKEINKTSEVYLKINNETGFQLEAEQVSYVLEYAASNKKYIVDGNEDYYQDFLEITLSSREDGYDLECYYENVDVLSSYQKNSLLSFLEEVILEDEGKSVPDIQVKDISVVEENGTETIAYYVSIFVIYLFILLCGGIITGSVALEKISKVSELLIYRVSPAKIIYSKILALFTLLLSIGLVAGLEILLFHTTGLMDVGSFIENLQLSGISMSSIGVILGIMILGIAVYTILYIIVGMFIQSADQIQFAQFPVAAVALMSYVVSILSRSTPDSWIACSAMYVPLFYPFVAPLRVIGKLCSIEEIVISTGLLLLFLAVGNILMSKLFRREAY